MPIRILIVDDHRLLRAGLKTLLNPDLNLEVVGEATSGEEALQVAQQVRPDVILMDMAMSGMDGLTATRALLQALPDTRILIMTMYEDGALVQECIRAGASGYIVKRAAESELVDAIYAVWRGMIYIHPTLMRTLVTPPRKPQPTPGGEAEALSSRETEVLQMIVKGYTNRQIAVALSISVRTVETHRSNIMEKLNLHSRVDLVRYANEKGLV